MFERSSLDYPLEVRPRELAELARHVTIKGRHVRRRRRALSATGALAVLAAVAAVGVSVHAQGDRLAASVLAAASPTGGSSAATAVTSQQLTEAQRVQGVSSAAGVFAATSQAAPTFFVGATGAGAEQQTVYDSATGNKLRTLGPPGQRLGVLSGDRATLYLPVGSCGGYDAFDVATGSETPAWGGLGGLRAALPSPDGTHLVYDTCAQNGRSTTLVVRNLRTGAMTSSTFAGNVFPESWSPDQSRIVVSNRPGGAESLLLLNASTLQVQGNPILDASSRCVLASPQLVSSTTFIAVEDCAGGAVNLAKVLAADSGPARLIGLTGVYSDPVDTGSPFSTMSLDSSHEHAVVQVSRAASQPLATQDNGLVFTVDAAGSAKSSVADTYQVQW